MRKWAPGQGSAWGGSRSQHHDQVHKYLPIQQGDSWESHLPQHDQGPDDERISVLQSPTGSVVVSQGATRSNDSSANGGTCGVRCSESSSSPSANKHGGCRQTAGSHCSSGEPGRYNSVLSWRWSLPGAADEGLGQQAGEQPPAYTWPAGPYSAPEHSVAPQCP